MFLKTSELDFKSKFFSTLIALFPLSFIAGNLVINLNIVILIVSAFIFFGKEIFRIKFNIIDKLITVIFVYILFVGIFNTVENFYFIEEAITDTVILKKTILFFRYFLVYFILRFLVEKKILSLRFLFLFSIIGSLFVSFDLIYQFIFNYDIFGYEKIGRKYPGPFGNEAIAGGYLQRFSLIGIFYVILFSNQKDKKYLIVFVSFLIILFIVSIGISGNRMPLLLFAFIVILIFLFEEKLRKFLILLAFVLSLIFFSLNKFVPTFSQNIQNFTHQISWIYEHWAAEDKELRTAVPSYYFEFSSFYETWRMNEFLGGGIKSFRINCLKRDNVIEKWRDFSCNMHPHNYYLEILTDLGLVGFLLIIFLLYKLLYLAFFKYFKYLKKDKLRYILTPLIFLLIAEFFPLRSSGSFFTTNNSAFIFILIALIASFFKGRNLN